MKPERAVRSLVHRLGYRFRLHAKDLPGKPDLVFRSRKKAIFVHGCFWHRHPNCGLARLPKSRLDFWMPKLEGNRKRDLRTQAVLRRSGWQVLIVWECQIQKESSLSRMIKQFLDS
jgi:DNA mismatch endonuclease (patch repair protein)